MNATEHFFINGDLMMVVWLKIVALKTIFRVFLRRNNIIKNKKIIYRECYLFSVKIFSPQYSGFIWAYIRKSQVRMLYL